MNCKCGSLKLYSECCGVYIDDGMLPNTSEQLMRSRYTAYTQANIDYIIKTMHGRPLKGFDRQSTEQWAANITWQRLEVISSTQLNNKGFVEFKAYYIDSKQNVILHEVSEFKRKNGQWLYINGILQ